MLKKNLLNWPCEWLNFFVSGYKEISDADLPGMFDYRCRFSLSSAGCSVSVYDQREAEDICDMDEECKGFVMSSSKTWTGQ